METKTSTLTKLRLAACTDFLQLKATGLTLWATELRGRSAKYANWHRNFSEPVPVTLKEMRKIDWSGPILRVTYYVTPVDHLLKPEQKKVLEGVVQLHLRGPGNTLKGQSLEADFSLKIAGGKYKKYVTSNPLSADDLEPSKDKDPSMTPLTWAEMTLFRRWGTLVQLRSEMVNALGNDETPEAIIAFLAKEYMVAKTNHQHAEHRFFSARLDPKKAQLSYSGEEKDEDADDESDSSDDYGDEDDNPHF